MTDDDRAVLAADIRLAESPGGLPVLKAYRDTKGIWTIGHGTNLQELTIDRATAERWFADKLAVSEREASRFMFYAAQTPARQRVLVELIYNMGLPKVLGFVKFLRAMADGDYVAAHRELLDSDWATQVGPTRSNRLADTILQG